MCHELLLPTASWPEEGGVTEVEEADAVADVALVIGAEDVAGERIPEVLIPGSLVSRIEDVELPLLREALHIFSEGVRGRQ